MEGFALSTATFIRTIDKLINILDRKPLFKRCNTNKKFGSDMKSYILNIHLIEKSDRSFCFQGLAPTNGASSLMNLMIYFLHILTNLIKILIK